MRTMTLVLAWTMLAKTVFGAKHCVGAQGDDANAGTKAQPWQTPGKACATVRPGDTVRLGAGACRETLRPKLSGGAGKPIRFAAPPGGKVVPSGGGPLAGTWRPYQGGICRLAKRPGFAQLSVDGKTMLEARWPNSPVTDPMDMRRARAGEGTGYGALADPKLPAGDWNGAVAIFRPGGEWVDWARRVTECQPGKSFRSDVATEAKARDKYRKEDPCKPRAGNPYPPVGALAGLDGPGEWFLDGATCTVRLWAVDGKSPAGRRVGVGQRLPAVDPGKPAFIGVGGVDIGGAAVAAWPVARTVSRRIAACATPGISRSARTARRRRCRM